MVIQNSNFPDFNQGLSNESRKAWFTGSVAIVIMYTLSHIGKPAAEEHSWRNKDPTPLSDKEILCYESAWVKGYWQCQPKKWWVLEEELNLLSKHITAEMEV